jgi:uncharacterized C2H2 Zn-finger protein
MDSKSIKGDRSPRSKLVSASGLECPMCGAKFTRRSNCKEHQKAHDPSWKKKHPCEECGKTFGRMADLKRHLNSVSHGIFTQEQSLMSTGSFRDPPTEVKQTLDDLLESKEYT